MERRCSNLQRRQLFSSTQSHGLHPSKGPYAAANFSWITALLVNTSGETDQRVPQTGSGLSPPNCTGTSGIKMALCVYKGSYMASKVSEVAFHSWDEAPSPPPSTSQCFCIRTCNNSFHPRTLHRKTVTQSLGAKKPNQEAPGWNLASARSSLGCLGQATLSASAPHQ